MIHQLFTARCTIEQSAVLWSHVVRLSVCLSGTSVDQYHIGWKSWKLIARTIISPTLSLFVAQRPFMHYSRGTLWEILRRIEVGWGKLICWRTKAAISLKRVKIEEKLLWRAYRNSPTLFRTVPFQTTYTRKFFGYPLLSQTQIWLVHSQGPSEQKLIKFFGKGGVWAYPGAAHIYAVFHIISKAGKASNFKFCTHIPLIDRNKSPRKHEKFWEK